MLHKYSTWGQALTLAFLFLFLFCSKAAAQTHSEILHYKVINGDTLFVERITPSRCYSRLPRQKGKEWRKYYRLVHNFAKTYPYALASKKIMISVDIVCRVILKDYARSLLHHLAHVLKSELFLELKVD